MLRAPEYRKFNSPGERLDSQINRLAPFGDRLDDTRREKTERNEPPHRATVIEYWHVDDQDLATPDEAFQKIEHNVTALIKCLSAKDDS